MVGIKQMSRGPDRISRRISVSPCWSVAVCERIAYKSRSASGDFGRANCRGYSCQLPSGEAPFTDKARIESPVFHERRGSFSCFPPAKVVLRKLPSPYGRLSCAVPAVEEHNSFENCLNIRHSRIAYDLWLQNLWMFTRWRSCSWKKRSALLRLSRRRSA